jgi:hypothetical protein
MSGKSDFPAVFARLKAILQAYETQLKLDEDGAEGYMLNAPVLGLNKKPLFFGGVQIKKNYVSYYLFPVYMYPDLMDGVSESLKQRMQGKSCFNFKSMDEAQMAELAALTQRSFERQKQAWT